MTGVTSGEPHPLDMEPFEVLRDMTREEAYPSIGGPPQVVKVYRHMNSLPFGVYWPTRESGVKTLLGRPLLDYEIPGAPVIDPDRPTSDQGNRGVKGASQTEDYDFNDE